MTLKDLIAFYQRNIAIGHTYTAIHGIKNNESAILIVSSLRHAKMLSQQYDVNINKFIGINQNRDVLEGIRVPMIIDHHALSWLFYRNQEEWREKLRNCEPKAKGGEK